MMQNCFGVLATLCTTPGNGFEIRNLISRCHVDSGLKPINKRVLNSWVDQQDNGYVHIFIPGNTC